MTHEKLIFILTFCLCATITINLRPYETISKLHKPHFHNNQCSYGGVGWNKIVILGDTLFPSFFGWLPFFTQIYISKFPIDNNEPNIVKDVRKVLFSFVKPTPFKSKTTLAATSSDALVKCLNLHPSVQESPDFLKFISGHHCSDFPPALAHRYGGHQFGSWSGQLGDGRAALLGTFLNKDGIVLELNLKGSGITPYSRHGDGRAVLRSSVREFLVSEAMHFLGVPTSRALSLVLSTDTVVRDEFYNGRFKEERSAMVVRIAPSWFRIGSLEILAFTGELALLKSLLDYVIERHFTHIDIHNKDKYLMLFNDIVNGTAHLIAVWQSIGFTHGVCNTDNFSLLSITIDYGPFGFLDDYNINFVPNTSDDEGRYSYRNQPSVGYFNLNKLRLALNSVLTWDQVRAAKVILNDYYTIFNRTFYQRFSSKLGLPISSWAANAKLITMFLNIMQQTRADLTMSFRQLGETKLHDLLNGAVEPNKWALTRLKSHSKFKLFLEKYRSRLEEERISDSDRRREMCLVNPVYVLRNWMAQAAIEQAEINNFEEIKRLQRVLSSPFDRQTEAEISGYAFKPPPWASNIKVSCSS